MNPETDFKEIERIDGHIWGFYKKDVFQCCLNCMMIRRRDKQNSPCRGKHKLRPMEKLIGT